MSEKDKERIKPLLDILSNAINSTVEDSEKIPEAIKLLRENGFDIELAIFFNVKCSKIGEREENNNLSEYDVNFLKHAKISFENNNN